MEIGGAADSESLVSIVNLAYFGEQVDRLFFMRTRICEQVRLNSNTDSIERTHLQPLADAFDCPSFV